MEISFARTAVSIACVPCLPFYAGWSYIAIAIAMSSYACWAALATNTWWPLEENIRIRHKPRLLFRWMMHRFLSIMYHSITGFLNDRFLWYKERDMKEVMRHQRCWRIAEAMRQPERGTVPSRFIQCTCVKSAIPCRVLQAWKRKRLQLVADVSY